MKLFRSICAMLGVVAVLGLLAAGATQAAEAKKQAPKAQPKAKITAAQANKIALKKYPGRIVGKTKLEDEEGTWQYGVMVKSGKTLREIMVNAKTGKIDSVEVTTAEKEGLEAKADAAKAKKGEKGEKDEKSEKGEAAEKGESK